jgi:serine/threonine protein kinase
MSIDLNVDIEFPPDMKKLGSGGTAFILKAKMISSQLILKYGETDAAVKIIKESKEDKMESIRKNFLYEISIMSALPKSPNIVQMFGYSNEPMAIVMKFYSFSLKDLITKKDFQSTPEIILKVAFDIAAGLNEIHQNHILHLDIKPRMFSYPIKTFNKHLFPFLSA